MKEGFNSWNKLEKFASHIGDIGGAHNKALKRCDDLFAYCFEKEILNCIFKEIGDDVLVLLVDESSDVSKKELMAIVLRYVDTQVLVKERFVGLVNVGIVNVMETSSSSLKFAIDTFFAKHGLSFKRMRGQGYDKANNMYGEFNGLKARILEENNSAYYIHCFAHQLQLVVVTAVKKHLGVVNFFNNLSILMNVVCSSCKQTDILRENEKERVEKEIGCGILEIGSGLNQELSFILPEDTKWNSHFKTLIRLIDMFPSITKVFEYVKDECTNPFFQNQAIQMLNFLSSFEFMFYLYLMEHILVLTDTLSKAL